MLTLAKTLIALALLIVPISAQEKENFGWDLSYKSVLERNNVGKSELISLWLNKNKSPAEDWIKNWNGKPIVSSILIEYPNHHAAQRTTFWFVRTSDEAFYWELIEGLEKDQIEEPIKTKIYDALFAQVSSWQQLAPKSPKDTTTDEWPGYFGFLSSCGTGGSKQMLITTEDFSTCPAKSCVPGTLGRLMAALEPIWISEHEKNYKHKTEAEIAWMTPEQRIDETIMEESERTMDHEKYRLLLQRYRRNDGLKGWKHLIELIDSYVPKTRDSRYSSAMRMAEDIDERGVRLRGTTEGRRIIEAIERLSIRMRSAGKEDQTDSMLSYAKGVNFTDLAIRETMWVKYRIKMSDSELLEFSNYLIRRDPTYPRWSEQVFIKDYSRKNEEAPLGTPLQVYIMRKPSRYYQLYRAFKRQPQ